MKVIGVVPGTWRQSDEKLFFDNQNNVLSYRLIVDSKMVIELRKRVKELGRLKGFKRIRSHEKIKKHELYFAVLFIRISTSLHCFFISFTPSW